MGRKKREIGSDDITLSPISLDSALLSRLLSESRDKVCSVTEAIEWVSDVVYEKGENISNPPGRKAVLILDFALSNLDMFVETLIGKSIRPVEVERPDVKERINVDEYLRDYELKVKGV